MNTYISLNLIRAKSSFLRLAVNTNSKMRPTMVTPWDKTHTKAKVGKRSALIVKEVSLLSQKIQHRAIAKNLHPQLLA